MHLYMYLGNVVAKEVSQTTRLWWLLSPSKGMGPPPWQAKTAGCVNSCGTKGLQSPSAISAGVMRFVPKGKEGDEDETAAATSLFSALITCRKSLVDGP